MANTYRELDPGIYRVFESSIDVGEVYAEGVAGQTVVEHWVLLDGHKSPTGSSTMNVHESSAGYTSLSGFFTAMQARIDASGKSGTYVKATCIYQTIKVTP